MSDDIRIRTTSWTVPFDELKAAHQAMLARGAGYEGTNDLSEVLDDLGLDYDPAEEGRRRAGSAR